MATLTGHDRDAEAAIQQRILDALELRFSDDWARFLTASSQQMVDAYARNGADPALPMEMDSQVRALYLRMGLDSITAFGGRIIDQGKSRGLVLEHKFSFAEFFQRMAEEWIAAEAIRERITAVAMTTRDLIVSRILRGQQDGLGVDAIARGLRKDVPSLSRYRAHVISRTETHGAANYGAFSAANATGLTLEKEWVSVHDLRTRRIAGKNPSEFDHWAMDGQKRHMYQPFDMPWTKRPLDPLKIMHPGESGAPAGAVIACRCCNVYNVI